MTNAAVLLAAGHSRRFGRDDKLLAKFLGKPLVLHAADALERFAPDHLVAVVSSQDVADVLPHFDVQMIPGTLAEQSESLKRGYARAIELGARRILVVLGDMPFVTPGLLAKVVGQATDTLPAAASDGKTVMPPVCLPATWSDAINALTGDRGAAALLRDLPEQQRIVVKTAALTDIDTPEAMVLAEQAGSSADQD